MGALLALIPKKDIVYSAVIVAIVVGGLWYHHELIAEGIAKQQAADSAATATLTAKTAEQTAQLQARAALAEQAYDKERNDNQTYRDSHPNEPVRLCITAPSGAIVSQAGTPHSRNANAGTAAPSVQPVPDGNPTSGAGRAGPDIEPMLSAFAFAADDISAKLREYQARDH